VPRHASEYDPDDLVARKADQGLRISVCLPARNEEATVGHIVATVRRTLMETVPLVDEVVVIDDRSTDATAEAAAWEGARVLGVDDVLPETTPGAGKGNAMWKSLHAARGDLICWLDADVRNFAPHFVTGLLGPLVTDADTAFVKGYYRRPLHGEPTGGGRVTELVARPFLNLHVPAAAGFLQPLAGEVAARRDLLERLSFPVGYGVEIAMLIDALGIVGLERMAQVDLGTRQNRHQPLAELSAMALAVLAAAERRVHGPEHVDAAAPGPLLVPHGGELVARSVVVDERPPLATLAARLAG
jgi:glucosyl-3-phosphoglycerate synthase